MTVLIQRTMGGEAVYTRLQVVRPPQISSHFNYDRKDEVSESNQKTSNQLIIKEIINTLKSIKNIASNGFKNKDLSQQIQTIEESKLSILPILSEGSFYLPERARLVEITSRIIDRYYMPYLNQNSLPNSSN